MAHIIVHCQCLISIVKQRVLSHYRCQRMDNGQLGMDNVHTPTGIESNYEHSSTISDHRASERSCRGQRLSQLCDVEQSFIDAHDGRRAAHIRHGSRFRARSYGDDIRRGGKADASHDDAGGAAAGRRFVAPVAGAVPRAPHGAAESCHRGHRSASHNLEPGAARNDGAARA